MNHDNPHGFTYYGKAGDGVEITLTLPLEGLVTPKDIAAYCQQVVAEMKSHGFTRSERLDKPAGGWGGGGGRPGGPRPEETPPAHLVVPEHCGVSMIYRPPKDAQGDRKPVAARWKCRKGKDCAEAEERGGNKYGATNWHLTPKPVAAPPAGVNGASAGVMGYGDFLTAALQQYGLGKAAVLKFARTNEDELRALGHEGWISLLDKMQATKADAS